MNVITLIVVAGALWWFAAAPVGPRMTLIYADWCPHCTAILPTWRGFAFPGVAISWIDQRFSSLKVARYPTWIYTSADGVMEEYSGPRTVEAWRTFLESKSGVQTK